MTERHDQSRTLLSKPGMLLDLLLAGVFFVLCTLLVIPSHVPFTEPVLRYGFSAFTSFSLAGVFWMGLGLFRVTLADHRAHPERARHKYPEA